MREKFRFVSPSTRRPATKKGFWKTVDRAWSRTFYWTRCRESFWSFSREFPSLVEAQELKLAVSASGRFQRNWRCLCSRCVKVYVMNHHRIIKLITLTHIISWTHLLHDIFSFQTRWNCRKQVSASAPTRHASANTHNSKWDKNKRQILGRSQQAEQTTSYGGNFSRKTNMKRTKHLVEIFVLTKMKKSQTYELLWNGFYSKTFPIAIKQLKLSYW